jgi:hypothetical protein
VSRRNQTSSTDDADYCGRGHVQLFRDLLCRPVKLKIQVDDPQPSSRLLALLLVGTQFRERSLKHLLYAAIILRPCGSWSSVRPGVADLVPKHEAVCSIEMLTKLAVILAHAAFPDCVGSVTATGVGADTTAASSGSGGSPTSPVKAR